MVAYVIRLCSELSGVNIIPQERFDSRSGYDALYSYFQSIAKSNINCTKGHRRGQADMKSNSSAAGWRKITANNDTQNVCSNCKVQWHSDSLGPTNLWASYSYCRPIVLMD